MDHPASSGPTRSRRWGYTAATGAMAAALLFAGTSPALAANDYLQFSVDGQTFTPTVSGPLFSQSFTYVPGATAASTLWVRNNSSEPASLSSAAVVVRSAPELNGYLGLAAGLQSQAAARAPLGLQGSCSDIDQSWDLAAGEDLQLNFIEDMSVDAPNETRNRQAEFDVVFLLESKAAGTAPRAACSAWSNGPGGSGSPGEPAPGGAGEAGGATAVVAGGSVGAGNGGGAGGGIEAGSGAGAAGGTGGGPGQGADLAVVAGTIDPVPLPTDAGVDAETGQQVRGSRWTSSLEAGPGNRPDIAQAGFASTVEPIIRSWSGTLLIAMSVVFSAALILRTRKRQA